MTISPAPTQKAIFNANFDILGEYVTDDSRVPYFNPLAEDVMIEPGEPVLFVWNGGTHVMLAQRAIFPGETAFLDRYFTVDLPATLSAQVNTGDLVHWDFTNKVVAFAAVDTTNGWPLGTAIWALDPNIKNDDPAIQGTDSVIAGTTASTKIRVVVSPESRTAIGTVLTLNVDT